MDVNITKAQLQDIDAVEALYNDVCDYLADKEYNPGFRKGYFPTRENALYFLKSESLYVARIDGKVVGSIALTYNPSAELEEDSATEETGNKLGNAEILYVHIVVVHPDYHRSGVGSKMLEFCDEYGRNEGVKTLRLSVWEGNSVAIKAYEKNGYKRIGKEDIGLGEYGLEWFYLYEKKFSRDAEA